MKRTTIDRIRRYAGKDRKQVVNPNITAREAIQIADHIQEIESSLESHHRDLLVIHRVAACVAQVEPPTEEDTLTVRGVKQMAMMINRMSGWLDEARVIEGDLLYRGQPQSQGVPEGWHTIIQGAIDELGIIDESEGIAGWHLNGAIASWDESGLPAIRDALVELLTTPAAPQACQHGVRLPHPCSDCENGVEHDPDYLGRGGK